MAWCSVKRWMATLLGIVAVSGGGCENTQNRSLRVAGQIEVVAVELGSRVGGRVAEVLVAEGDRVATGALLLRLEDEEALAGVRGG